MRHRDGPHLPLLAEEGHAGRSDAAGAAAGGEGTRAAAAGGLRTAEGSVAQGAGGHEAARARGEGRNGPRRKFRALPPSSPPRKRGSSFSFGGRREGAGFPLSRE